LNHSLTGMLLSHIAAASRRVSETRSRLEKIDALESALKALLPDEIEIGTAYLSGELRQGKIGITANALGEALRVPGAHSRSLTLVETDQRFDAIASTRGAGSAAKRNELLRELFALAGRDEQEFLVRLIVGELRQGALEAIVLDAIAKAAKLPTAEIRKAAMLAGSVPLVAKTALSEGAAGLARFSLTLFSPVLPMLAQPAKDVSDALRQIKSAAFEWKLDGARVQVHKSGAEVRVYTRNLNDVTVRVPEIVEQIAALSVRELILDGEAIALQPGGAPHPFQITMQRFGRKLKVAEMRVTLPLNVFFFDILYLDGAPLVGEDAKTRFAVLDAILPQVMCVPRLIGADAAHAREFLQDALDHGHEGVMAKSLDAPYEAGRRGAAWLKIKQARTLDLVVLAAEWGHGRRQGYLSNLHLGARDSESGGFVMLGKTFKGMTDEMLAWQTRKLLELETSRDDYTVYVRPELVVEIAFDSLQISSQYPGGLALRFARVKGYRPDKRAEEADTIETVRAIGKSVRSQSASTTL
ncbi:MAG: ATP-dependent DNA ligase, partial [Burkholderiales bacterium]